QPGVAIPIHGDAGGGDRQTGPERGHTSDVVSGWTVRLTAPEDHLVHFLRVERGSLAQHMTDRMRREIVRARDVERPAVRFGKRRSRTGNDDGFSHGTFDLRP